MSCLRTWVWFGPRTEAILLFSPYMGFSVVVVAIVNVNCHGVCGCVI